MTIYEPLPAEYITTGVIGILLYLLVLIWSLSALHKGIVSIATKFFYVCLLLTALFELPRFFELAINASYVSRTTYSLHVLAGSFFFASFSVVCYQWGALLQVGSLTKLFMGKNALFVANAVFLVVDIASMSLCLTSPSLRSYFRSPAYIGLTVLEGIKNCVYVGMLSYNGICLVRKLWNYSREELQHSTFWTEVCTALGCEGWYCMRTADHYRVATTGDPENEEETKEVEQVQQQQQQPDRVQHVFLGVVIRVTYVLVLTSVCFALRICMIILKILAMHTSAQITAPNFSLFGFAWTVLGDFIPRVVPALAFMQLMHSQRAGSARRRTLSTETHRSTARSGDKFALISSSEGDCEPMRKSVAAGAEGLGNSNNSSSSSNNSALSLDTVQL